MPILASEIKFYKSDNDDSEGGSISLAEQITTATLHNLFPSVTVDEAEDGNTDYRKFFMKNTHASAPWTNITAWVQAVTPSGDDEVYLGLGTDADDDGSNELTPLTTNSQITLVSNAFDTRTVTLVGEDASGNRISEAVNLNSAADVVSTNTFAKLYLASVAITAAKIITIKRGSTALGTIGENLLSAITYYNPTVKVSGFKLGSVVAGAYQAFWLKRVVQAGALAHENNQIILEMEGETT